MDIKTSFSDPAGLDWSLDGYQLATDTGLTTAVLLSLFTDARVEEEEVSGDAFSRRGWWASELVLGAGQQLGSKLWLLSRVRDRREVVCNARQWSVDALQWIVDQGVASSVEVNAELQGQILALEVLLTRPNAAPLTQRFNLSWGV